MTFFTVDWKTRYFISQVAVMNGDLIFITTACDSCFDMFI